MGYSCQCYWCSGSIHKDSPSPHHGRCCIDTSQTLGHALESLSLTGEEWEGNKNPWQSISLYLHQWYWKCSHPVGFGKLLCGIWSKHVVRGEGKDFPIRISVLKLLQMSWAAWSWSRAWAAQGGLLCSRAWSWGFLSHNIRRFQKPSLSC